MIYFILDNIYNTDNVTNGIYFRYQELIFTLLKKKKYITLITKKILNIKYPKSKYFKVIFINFIAVPFAEISIPLPTYNDINLLIKTIKKNSILITLLDYISILYFIPILQKKNKNKLILGYHTRLDIYTKQYYKFFIPLYYFYEMIWNKLSPKIIFSSGYATNNILKKKFNCKIYVWYQMNSYFINNNPNYPLFNNKKQITLIYTGRIYIEKNIYDLFKILELYNYKYGKAVLIIIGNGPELDNIKKISIKSKYKIIIRGLIPNDQLINEYSKYINPFYVFPSVSETLGKSIIEANLCMIPTISALSEETLYLYKDDFNGYIYETINECCYKINYFFNKSYENKIKLLNDSRNFFIKLFKNSTDKICKYI